MKNDLTALAGIFLLVTVFAFSPKVGGYLIAIVVLGMLLQINKLGNNLEKV